MTGLLPMRSLWWYVASHAVMVIAIAVALYHYPQLPDPLPLHWGQDGTVDNAAPKTIPTVLFLVGLGPAIVIAAGAGFAGYSQFFAYNSRERDAVSRQRTILINKTTQLTLGFFTLSVTTAISFLVTRALVWTVETWELYLCLSFIIAVLVWAVSADIRARRHADIIYPPSNYKPRALKGGMFYWDEGDSRTFIELDANTMALNLAKPSAWAVMAMLLIPVFVIGSVVAFA